MNLDAALRYQPIVKRIEDSQYRSQVLEVGSGTNGISDYYSGKVLGVDEDFSKTKGEKNPNIEHVRASIYKLPFKDESFDIVVCLDTLEHIEKTKREKAIMEILRVVEKKGMIFLGFPTGTLSAKFEEKINDLFKKIHGKNHPWLWEHQSYGLPEKEEVLEILNQNKKIKNIEIVNNVNLIVWFIMHVLFTVYINNIFVKILRYFNKILFHLFKINLPPYYRVILVIKK